MIKNNSSATGYEIHKYRFQKNNFELIGYTSEYSDRQGTSYTSDLNLMTGFQIDTEENYETNQIIKKEKKFVEIYELPTLSNFKRSEEGYY